VSEPPNSPSVHVGRHGVRKNRPRPAAKRGYTALLEWSNLTSGPMQVIGANLVAVFPMVTVINETNNDFASMPSPPVTLDRTLVPGGDFTCQGGS
jgi:hypothetical protein